MRRSSFRVTPIEFRRNTATEFSFDGEAPVPDSSPMSADFARRGRLSTSLAPAGLAMGFATVLAGALLLWLGIETIRSLHTTWLGYYYSHGYLVLVLTAFLVFLEVRRAPLAPCAPSWLGLTALIFLVAIAFIGWATSTQSVAQLVWPFSMIATIWAFAGAGNARRFILPIGYLCVAIPIWDGLIAPLQALTIRVVTGWIHMANLPAFIEGNLIHVPSGTFEIAEGCGGLRYALVAVALAAFSGILHHNRWKPTALLALLALGLAMVGNWIRVFATVAVGLAPPTGLASVIVRDYHTPFGWALFVVIMLPFFYVERLYQPGIAPRSR